MNYRITTRSRVGGHSQIEAKSHIEGRHECRTVTEALTHIRNQATVHGWRDFTLETIGEPLKGIPLE